MLTDQPLQNTLERYESSEKMLRWAIELIPYKINYEHKRAIKAQALPDFKCSIPDKARAKDNKLWMLYVNGSTINGYNMLAVV